MGHDGSYAGVDPPGCVFASLGQPGTTSSLSQDGVGDVAASGGSPKWVSLAR
jgi:hypothetical protein